MNRSFRNSQYYLGVLSLLFFVMIQIGCKVNYSFSGASIPAEAKTFSVFFFKNTSYLVEPTLSQNFTDALRSRLSNQTRLTQVELNGDLHFEGAITNYTPSQPAAIASETASLNRLSITVSVKFVNTVEPHLSFEKSFTQFVDYDSGLDLGSVQSTLMDEVIVLLVDDIFNQSVANW
ncbi:MAG: LPS assembly lipoprotein LptE [Bacteroidales bacterium]|jgi:hypothetical protein|nr:LPS assembly lipoprotein LptE [Bacteroidales bacterium]